jgi:heat shock protein HslJ
VVANGRLVVNRDEIHLVTPFPFAQCAGWLFLLIGCSEQTQQGETSGVKKTLVGEVFYRERILLPPGAKLHLTLEDVSKMDVPSTVIATASQVLAGAPPYEFSLDYYAEDIDSRIWKLVSLNETDVVMVEAQEREAFLQLRDDTKSVKGFAGCNTFTGSYTVNGNDLSFGPLAATRKACPAGMETETEFFQVLDGTTHFSVHEETLTLLNERKKPVARLVAVYFD